MVTTILLSFVRLFPFGKADREWSPLKESISLISLTRIFLLSSCSKCLVRQPTQTNFVSLRLAARPWLVANMWPMAWWRPAAEPLLAACWPPSAGSVDRAAGCINSLRIVFLTLHQVSSLHEVSATCTHAHDAGALNGFWLKMTWWRYSTFHFSVCTAGVKRYGRKVANDTPSDIFFKI